MSKCRRVEWLGLKANIRSAVDAAVGSALGSRPCEEALRGMTDRALKRRYCGGVHAEIDGQHERSLGNRLSGKVFICGAGVACFYP